MEEGNDEENNLQQEDRQPAELPSSSRNDSVIVINDEDVNPRAEDVIEGNMNAANEGILEPEAAVQFRVDSQGNSVQIRSQDPAYSPNLNFPNRPIHPNDPNHPGHPGQSNSVDSNSSNQPEQPVTINQSNEKKRKRSKSKSKTPSKKKADISVSDDIDEGITCPICLDQWEMSGTHRLTSLKCGHLFGHSCIKRWLQQQTQNVRCCPSCKTRAAMRDLRFIYAKRICAIDNSEENRLREQLELEKVKNSKLQADFSILNLEMTVTKRQIVDLKSQIEKMSRRVGDGSSTSFNSSDFPRCKTLYKLFMEKNIEITKEPGCRVMSYGRKIKHLVVSQKSTLNLFPGYGLRFIDSKTFRPTNFVHVSAKSVRDLCFSENEDLVVTATMEKTVKVFSTHDKTVASVFAPSDKMIWACSIDKESKNFLYLGSQHGSTYVYDIRNSSSYVEEFKNNGDVSPVINICPVPTSSTLPFGGFLVCKLQSVWFYEYTPSQEIAPVRLNVEGPFVSMTYESSSENILIATRPTTKYPMSRYIIGNIIKVDNIATMNVIDVFFGSKIQSIMSRCTQICMPDDTLVAGYMQDTKLLTMWNVSDGNRIQSLPITDTVLDTCSIYDNNNVYLAALTDCKCRIYKVTQSEK